MIIANPYEVNLHNANLTCTHLAPLSPLWRWSYRFVLAAVGVIEEGLVEVVFGAGRFAEVVGGGGEDVLAEL